MTIVVRQKGKKMSDLISRVDAIEAVSRGCKEFRGIFQDCEEAINELPSAQPRTGKWITDNPHSEIYRYACSECHAHHRARYDFCPSCGCRMEEGDAE